MGGVYKQQGRRGYKTSNSYSEGANCTCTNTHIYRRFIISQYSHCEWLRLRRARTELVLLGFFVRNTVVVGGGERWMGRICTQAIIVADGRDGRGREATKQRNTQSSIGMQDDDEIQSVVMRSSAQEKRRRRRFPIVVAAAFPLDGDVIGPGDRLDLVHLTVGREVGEELS